MCSSNRAWPLYVACDCGFLRAARARRPQPPPPPARQRPGAQKPQKHNCCNNRSKKIPTRVIVFFYAALRYTFFEGIVSISAYRARLIRPLKGEQCDRPGRDSATNVEKWKKAGINFARTKQEDPEVSVRVSQLAPF